MVQNISWEWLAQGFKIELETQLKPKTVKDYCGHISYFARWVQTSQKGCPCSILKRDIQEFLHYVATNPAIFSTGNGTNMTVPRDENSRWHHYFPLKSHPVFICPFIQLVRNEFRTIVDFDKTWRAMHRLDAFYYPDLRNRTGGIRYQRVCLRDCLGYFRRRFKRQDFTGSAQLI